MSNRLKNYEYLRRNAWSGLWSKRILAELGFLLEVSAAEEYSLDGQLLPVVDSLLEGYRRENAITADMARAAEETLLPLSGKAKEYDVTCVAHAHIDMNWLWGMQETASLTIDTFMTMLRLMEEYPEFTFSQSQASVYEIVERFYPELLEQIKRRVHEGRWELTASFWVESDKNLSGGEAMARHLLYTRRYLSKLFDIPEDTVKVCFEPDTFGHSAQLPEILNKGGVKYYYHCRGSEDTCAYNWRTDSGAELLTLREPTWYHQAVDYDLLLNVPSYCRENHTKQYLKVYGVGDHGGGPTRRDLDRIVEMSKWPLFPTIRFGTLHGFFEKLEADRAAFPVVKGERNCIFTGCYTSQARTKQANRIGEDRLTASEMLDAMAQMLCPDYRTASPFEPAWRHVLFGQFHDILPGSGLRETREYALGHLQDTLAVANINANHAMDAICSRIHTGFLTPETDGSTAAGAGTGYGTDEPAGYRFPSTERGSGSVRAYALFNPTQYPRTETAEITVWDWNEDASRMYAENAEHKRIPIQVLSEGTYYWGHHGTKIAVPVELPPMGYTTVVLRNGEAKHVEWPLLGAPRVDHITDEPVILENEKLRAAFSPTTMQLLSLVSKASGREFMNAPGGDFCLATEECSNEMTAWRVGRFAKVANLSEESPACVAKITHGAVRQSIQFTLPFESSVLTAEVVLDSGSDTLRYNVSVDWKEEGSKEKGVPQLFFQLPLAKKMEKSRGVIPFGTIDRDVLKQDVPSLGILSDADDGETAALVSDCKYGFRNEGDKLTVDLIRASFDPDPSPEYGMHSLSFGIHVGSGSAESLIRECVCFANPPANHSVPIQDGELPLAGSLLTAEGCAVYAMKRAENADGLILRLFNPQKKAAAAQLRFAKAIQRAELLAIPEWPMDGALRTEADSVYVEMKPEEVVTLRVVF